MLDAAYGSRYARHFYGDEEIAAFRQRWLGAGRHPPSWCV
jgi:hypothetical protein